MPEENKAESDGPVVINISYQEWLEMQKPVNIEDVKPGSILLVVNIENQPGVIQTSYVTLKIDPGPASLTIKQGS